MYLVHQAGLLPVSPGVVHEAIAIWQVEWAWIVQDSLSHTAHECLGLLAQAPQFSFTWILSKDIPGFLMAEVAFQNGKPQYTSAY